MGLKELPCRATMVSWNEADGVGALETEHGEMVKCGRTSFQGLARAEIGRGYVIHEIAELPIIGMRAKRVNDPIQDQVDADRMRIYLAERAEKPAADDAPPIPTHSVKEALAWLKAHQADDTPLHC